MDIVCFNHGLFAVSLAILYVQPTVSKTIDELIVGAAKKVTSFDFLSDPNNNIVQHELDMLLTLEQWKGLMGKDTEDPSETSRQRRKAVKDLRRRWSNNEIPYQIQDGVFSARDVGIISEAIKEWEDNTCLTFRNVSSRDFDYVEFVDGAECKSNIGKAGGRQNLELAPGCRVKGVIIHEIGHAVGFYHEHNRPDRDDYVIIQLKNVMSEAQYGNFEKYSTFRIDTFGVPYDYRSVMHYGRKFFSGNRLDTIMTINPLYQDIIGNREGLSFYDIKLANLMYKCHDRCDPSIRCPGEGFIGKDCKCYCPGNPVQSCNTVSPTQQTTTLSMLKPTSTATPCDDMNNRCSDWAAAGHCHTNTNVMTFCPMSCMMCPGETRTTQKMCMDMREYCPSLRDQGLCQGLFELFMSQVCPGSCGFCGNNPINTSSSPGKNNASPLRTSYLWFPIKCISVLMCAGFILLY